MGKRAEEEHRDSHPGWDFMAGGQQWETELRRSTGTHTTGWDFMAGGQRSEKELRRNTGTHQLDGISWPEVSDGKQS
jgi:hypothetical protein